MANEIKIEISAKFEEGGAPSIKSILTQIDKVYKSPTGEEKNDIDILKILGTSGIKNENISFRLLKVAKILNIDGYQFIQKVTKKTDPSLNDINVIVNKIAMDYETTELRVKAFREIFNPYYKMLKNEVEDTSLRAVFASKYYPNSYSPVIKPLGTWIANYLNTNNNFQTILNNVSRSLETEQIYLNFKSTGMTFEKKLFKEATFKFEYGGLGKNSNNGGIKFSMK